MQHLRTLTLLRGESECEQRVALGANETRAITESECRETRAVSDAIGLRVTSKLTRLPADANAEGSARPAARLFSDGMSPDLRRAVPPRAVRHLHRNRRSLGAVLIICSGFHTISAYRWVHDTPCLTCFRKLFFSFYE